MPTTNTRTEIRTLLATRDSTSTYNFCERNYSEVREQHLAALYELAKHDAALVADVEREIKAEKAARLCGEIRAGELGGRDCSHQRMTLADLLSQLGHSKRAGEIRRAA